MSGGYVARPSVPRKLGNLDGRVGVMEAGLGPWVYPPLINSWVDAGLPFSDLAYRRGLGPQSLEFKGHITGGASGTVAFILDVDYWPDNDLSFLTDVGDVGAFMVGRILVDSTTGEVTVTFPAT
jgi:hypothetical protein